MMKTTTRIKRNLEEMFRMHGFHITVEKLHPDGYLFIVARQWLTTDEISLTVSPESTLQQVTYSPARTFLTWHAEDKVRFDDTLVGCLAYVHGLHREKACAGFLATLPVK